MQSVGLPFGENTIQYNSGFIAFKKSSKNQEFFQNFKKYLEIVITNQNLLMLRDQGAFAAGIEAVKPKMKTLSPVYNYLDKWKATYTIDQH